MRPRVRAKRLKRCPSCGRLVWTLCRWPYIAICTGWHERQRKHYTSWMRKFNMYYRHHELHESVEVIAKTTRRTKRPQNLAPLQLSTVVSYLSDAKCYLKRMRGRAAVLGRPVVLGVDHWDWEEKHWVEPRQCRERRNNG